MSSTYWMFGAQALKDNPFVHKLGFGKGNKSRGLASIVNIFFVNVGYVSIP